MSRRPKPGRRRHGHFVKRWPDARRRPQDKRRGRTGTSGRRGRRELGQCRGHRPREAGLAGHGGRRALWPVVECACGRTVSADTSLDLWRIANVLRPCQLGPNH
eukprot:scaffold2882_cov434-Prasinococcus_capsulatus_cf.AAC.6